jgi:transposase
LFPVELFGAPEGSEVKCWAFEANSISIFLQVATDFALCPLCGSAAQRIHSRYQRHLADLPCFGSPVRLEVTVRRFFCTRSECPRRIFAERLPGFVQPRARTTDRLRQTHCAIASALGGEAGSRLSAYLAMTTSPDTLLRRIKQFKDESAPPPRFVGIDDWAWLKGQRYGTIVVDLERSTVIDLLPDRDADTVKKWLNDHPGVELVSRDRWSAYAQASVEAAPRARQVVDRWHLLKNLREAIERLFERQFVVIGAALSAAGSTAELVAEPATVQAAEKGMAEDQPQLQPSSQSVVESSRHQAQHERRQKRVERFNQVYERHRQGHSLRRIARELGMSRCAVRRYLRCNTCPDWNPGRARRSRLDLHREWIDGRLAKGEPNALELHRQLTAMGFRGSYGSVRRYVTKRLEAAGKKRARINAAEPPAVPRPSAKQLSFAWVRRTEDRKPEEQAHLDAIRAASDELASALELADEFAALIRKHSQGTLSDWLAKAEASTCPQMRRFAEGIRRDETAVFTALTEPWSNGPVEGHVNRLKTIKRQMYGRAGFVLLRARVLKAA